MNLPGQFAYANENHYTCIRVTWYKVCLNIFRYASFFYQSKVWLFSLCWRKLKTCSHVEWRNDLIKGALQPWYSVSYEAVQRKRKVFTVNIRDRLKNVIIDRLKVAHLPDVTKRIPTAPVISAVPCDFQTTTHSHMQWQKKAFPFSRFRDVLFKLIFVAVALWLLMVSLSRWPLHFNVQTVDWYNQCC